MCLAIDFDPVAKGFVQSCPARGQHHGNILVHPLELAAKRIELAREAFPQARRLVLIWDSASADQVRAAAVTAQALGFEPRHIELEGHPADYAAAFAVNGGPDEPVIIPASSNLPARSCRDRAPVAGAAHSFSRRVPGAGVEAGLDAVLKLAKRAGIQDDLRPYPATFLGSSDVTLADLVTSYTMFPGNGSRPERLMLVTKIETQDGREIYLSEPKRIKVIEPRNRF